MRHWRAIVAVCLLEFLLVAHTAWGAAIPVGDYWIDPYSGSFDVFTIGPGGHYSNFDTAQAAQAGDLPARGKGCAFVFKAGVHTFGYTNYSSAWVTSAAYPLLLVGEEAHNGKWDDGDMTGGGALLDFGVNRFRIVTTSPVNMCFQDLKISGGTKWGLISMGTMQSGSTIQMTNVYLYSATGYPFIMGCSSGSALEWTAYNSIFIGANPIYAGAGGAGHVANWYNCILVNYADLPNSVDDYAGTLNNCSVSTPSATNTLNNCIDSTITDINTFVNPASPTYDFMPVKDGNAHQAGNNTYDHPAEDMLSTSRPATAFDIGALQSARAVINGARPNARPSANVRRR